MGNRTFLGKGIETVRDMKYSALYSSLQYWYLWPKNNDIKPINQNVDFILTMQFLEVL